MDWLVVMTCVTLVTGACCDASQVKISVDDRQERCSRNANGDSSCDDQVGRRGKVPATTTTTAKYCHLLYEIRAEETDEMLSLTSPVAMYTSARVQRARADVLQPAEQTFCFSLSRLFDGDDRHPSDSSLFFL